jgi:hypothetical protein
MRSLIQPHLYRRYKYIHCLQYLTEKRGSSDGQKTAGLKVSTLRITVPELKKEMPMGLRVCAALYNQKRDMHRKYD